MNFWCGKFWMGCFGAGFFSTVDRWIFWCGAENRRGRWRKPWNQLSAALRTTQHVISRRTVMQCKKTWGLIEAGMYQYVEWKFRSMYLPLRSLLQHFWVSKNYTLSAHHTTSGHGFHNLWSCWYKTLYIQAMHHRNFTPDSDIWLVHWSVKRTLHWGDKTGSRVHGVIWLFQIMKWFLVSEAHASERLDPGVKSTDLKVIWNTFASCILQKEKSLSCIF